MTQCSKGCSTKPTIGQRCHKITIVRMAQKSSRLGVSGSVPLGNSVMGQSHGGVEHERIEVFTTKAAIRTVLGLAERAGVSINEKRVTDKFMIRYHPRYFQAPKDGKKDYRFDTRDFVESNGKSYEILGIENLNEANQELILQCRFKVKKD